MIETIQECLAYYGQFLRNQWDTMTPMKYGIALLAIGLFGFMLLRSATKKV